MIEMMEVNGSKIPATYPEKSRECSALQKGRRGVRRSDLMAAGAVAMAEARKRKSPAE